jgi:putative flippase GtrA
MPILIISHYIKQYKSYIFRFAIVGIFTFGVNNLFFTIFNSFFNLNYKLAITFSYFLTVAFHFLLNHFFTFMGKVQVKIFYKFSKYLLMLILNYFITLVVVATTVEVFGLSPYFGIIFSTGATAISSFAIMNHFVFQREY